MLLADVALARRLATSSPRRARSCAASSTASPSAAWQAFAGTELEFIVFRDTYEEAQERAYRDLRPANLYNVDYSLLGTARVEPLIRRIRNAMAGAGMRRRGLQGRVQPRPARDQLPLRPRRCSTADEHAIYKNGRQGDRRAGGHGDHVHGEVRRARGQLVPHPPVAARDGDGTRSPTPRSSSASSPASSPCLRELTLFYAPNVNSYKRYAAGSFAPTAVRVGPRQPHVRDARRRPRPVAARREPRARRRRQPVPRARRDDRRRACTASSRASSSSPRSRATPTSRRRAARARARCARRASCSPAARSRARRSATRSSTTTSTTPTSSSRAFDAAVTDWERFRGFERL